MASKAPLSESKSLTEYKMKPYRWCIGIGLFLGIISSQSGYGAGGVLSLSITIGSLGLMTTSGPQRVAKVFIYCASLWGSFYIFGFRNISEPLSIYAIYATIGYVCIPTGIAFAITKSLNSVASRSSARNKNKKGA